jgi:hypothetical protein
MKSSRLTIYRAILPILQSPTKIMVAGAQIKWGRQRRFLESKVLTKSFPYFAKSMKLKTKNQKSAGSITKRDDKDCGKTDDGTWSRSWARLKRVQRNRKSRFI